MKDFKNTPQVNRLVKEIFGLAVEINSKTEYCVFVRFSGHVNQLEVEIARSKSDWEDKVSNRLAVYLNPYSKIGDKDYEKDMQEIVDKLESSKAKLEEFLNKLLIEF